MLLFNEDTKMFFAHKKLKKPPQKVGYLWQLGGFFLCSPDCPKQPRTSFPIYKFFYPTISGRISAWKSLKVCTELYSFCDRSI